MISGRELSLILKHAERDADGLLSREVTQLVGRIGKEAHWPVGGQEDQLTVLGSLISHGEAFHDALEAFSEVRTRLRKEQKKYIDVPNGDGPRPHQLRMLGATLSDAEVAEFGAKLDELLEPSLRARVVKLLAYCEQAAARDALRRVCPAGFVTVDAGWFVLGGGSVPDEQPGVGVWLPSYWIRKFPVCQPELESGTSCDPHHTATLDGTLLPATNLSWYEAFDFARRVGQRLPTEAEWEKAARGTNAWRYPYGPDYLRGRANTLEEERMGVTPVGLYSPLGDSPYGVSDLIGNTWEWTASEYAPYARARGSGILQRSESGLRVMRGGAFDFDAHAAHCLKRYAADPSNSWDTYGFRTVIMPWDEGKQE